MSSTSRPPETIEFEARLPPDADTQPVEPPPEPPGKGEWLRPSNRIPSVGGFDELTKTGVVKGWALDPDLPSGRCLVYFYVDGLMALKTYAGRAWAELAGTPGTQGAGHAFSWRIPDTYRDGRSHTLYVYAIDYSGLRCDSPLIGTRSFLLQPQNEAPVGVLEMVDGSGKVTGWAVDPNQGHEALVVSFYVSYSVIDDSPKSRVFAGQVRAGLSRPDVTEATGCQGGHGFEWTIPLEHRSAAKLYAYVNDTSTQARTLLEGSPKLLSVSGGDEL
ncbi:MAG TPA: hypothetical protein VNA24_27885 [Hyalangium sp.]|jgi:hypothetical protein|nr:hypothetical protein [Hyalangium sp.]